MPKKIAESDFIIVELGANLQAVGQVGVSVFSTKKLGEIRFALFTGLYFDKWYELVENQLAEFIAEAAYEGGGKGDEQSARKLCDKKCRKGRKLLRARELCPPVLLEYYALKDHSSINYVGHAELSYMLLFVEQGERLLVLDTKKGFFSYSVFYKNSHADLTAITTSDYYVLRYTENSIKKVSLFERLSVFYHTFFILGNCDVLKVLEFYQDNFYQVFVYTASRLCATKIFCSLRSDAMYLDVRMVDFFCREFQTNENVHPLVRCNTGSGYVVSAVRVQTRLENSTLHTNVTLLKSFFLELLVKKNTTVEFQSTKFHRHEMEFLDIKLEEYFVEFYWKFKHYTFTKVLCISHVSLKSIDFEYQESFELESSLIQEVVKQLVCSEIMFCFGDMTVFRNALVPESTFLAIPNSSRIRNAAFSVLRKSVKAATEGPFEKYDFLVDRRERRLNICAECDGITVSHMTTVFLLVSSMFGAGTITMPTCFVKLGYLGATIFLLAGVLATFTSLIFLTYSAEALQIFTYSGMCKELGRPLALALDAIIAVLCYGATISYGLYMVNYIQKLLPPFVSNEMLSRGIIGLAILAPLFFISQLKSLSKLSFVSWLALGATLLVIVELLSYLLFTNYTPKENSPVLAFGTDYAKGVPLIAFSLGCQQNVISIYSALADRTFWSSVKVMAIGCAIAGGIYEVIGYLGSRLLGAFSSDDFIEIFTDKRSEFIRYISAAGDRWGFFPRLCVFAFTLVLFAALPIQTFAARASIFNLLHDKAPTRKNIIIATVVHFAVIYSVILVGTIPVDVLTLIGAIASPMIGFVFPSIIYMKLVGYRKATFYLGALILVLSAATSGYSLYNFEPKTLWMRNLMGIKPHK
ncbi:UNVERIFIED_CONTAM: hypothetical protein PYX00_011305 [Menopon gallinae]|uniref:Amino acid transporter transmembrane domain-containing protein n=1 Tax=Menopon gallinae TaxID=328185 RepID=A0AAW2H730_9NEOP